MSLPSSSSSSFSSSSFSSRRSDSFPPPFSDKTVPRKKGGGKGRALSEMSNPEIRERVGAGFDHVGFSIFVEGHFIPYPTVPTNSRIWLPHELHFGDCLSDPPPFFSSWKTWLYGIRQPEWKEKGKSCCFSSSSTHCDGMALPTSQGSLLLLPRPTQPDLTPGN